ncbi:fumarylacetoacetate hydrolase family protein [Cupriavidus basilensis]|uniref:Fumarylacetoacetate hydrolase family protein n=1 Tax=Cupriavidus basilensis TaxID=68895 RepID=A0ABT6B1F5_9BURK|nr:fumarylacetoacetate hydrolase family protein [Cupriavidus basilensis]MDF3838716.1 fumarylacetoacetate hydrolase family protein [Cupriavidus basilensis]
MSATFNPGTAAALLADACRRGVQLRDLPADAKPATLACGYDVQDRFVAALGDPVVGWKLGVGSANAMRRASLARPLVGQVGASRCFASGDTVHVPAGAVATIEFEIAVRLARDVAPAHGELAPAALTELVQSAQVAFEVVLSRYEDRGAVGMPAFAGDNVGFHALVLGAQIDPASVEDVRASASVTLDGAASALPLDGDDAIYPLEALQSLLAHAAERGITLRKGTVVTTGTLTRPFDVAAGVHAVRATYAGGELVLNLAPQTGPG